MFGHVFDQLAAYAEHQLNAARRTQVERHLESCEGCRESLRRIRAGISYAADLPAEPMPPDIATPLRRQLVETPRGSDAHVEA